MLDQIGGCRLVAQDMTDQQGKDAPGQDDVQDLVLAAPMPLQIVDQRIDKRGPQRATYYGPPAARRFPEPKRVRFVFLEAGRVRDPSSG